MTEEPLSPCLRWTRTRPPLWNSVKRDSSKKTQCLHCLRSHILCVHTHTHTHTYTATSPVIQNESETPGGTPTPTASSQKPVYNAPTWQHPSKSAVISTCRGATEMKRLSLIIRINCLSSRSVVRLLQHPYLHWCGWIILGHTQHSCHFSEYGRQPPILHAHQSLLLQSSCMMSSNNDRKCKMI